MSAIVIVGTPSGSSPSSRSSPTQSAGFEAATRSSRSLRRSCVLQGSATAASRQQASSVTTHSIRFPTSVITTSPRFTPRAANAPESPAEVAIISPKCHRRPRASASTSTIPSREAGERSIRSSMMFTRRSLSQARRGMRRQVVGCLFGRGQGAGGDLAERAAQVLLNQGRLAPPPARFLARREPDVAVGRQGDALDLARAVFPVATVRADRPGGGDRGKLARFGAEPDRAAHAGGDAERAFAERDWKLADLAARRDPADAVFELLAGQGAAALAEPERPVGPDHDLPRMGAGFEAEELEFAARRDAADLVCLALGEPGGAVGADDDRPGKARALQLGCGDLADRADPPDRCRLAVAAGEPDASFGVGREAVDDGPAG